MDPELSAAEIEELLAAYAIDAVDDDERVLVARYLVTHPDAAAEVQAFRHAAALLAYTGGPVPDGVWDALAPALEERRRQAEAAAGAVPIQSRRPQSEPMPGSPTRRGAYRVRWLVAAAVAAILAVGAAVVVVVSDTGGGKTAQQQLADAARAARNAPGAREIPLSSADGSKVATAVVLRDGKGYLSSSLPPLDPSRTYQLWALQGNERISLGVLGHDPKVVAFTLPDNPSGIAVTNEVAGGVMSTTKTPVAVGLIKTA
jgi:anti-sigma-K factor RskA